MGFLLKCNPVANMSTLIEWSDPDWEELSSMGLLSLFGK